MRNHPKTLKPLLFALAFLYLGSLQAQLSVLPNDTEELADDVLRRAEFAIPSAPAFFLVGVTPEMVLQPGTVQDFKVDWRIKNYTLAPDLAIEAQPIWAFMYDKKGLNAYRNATPFMKTLSTLSTSFATAKIDGINHMSYALKISLFRERDPLSDPELLQSMVDECDELQAPFKMQMDSIQAMLDTVRDRATRLMLKEQLFELKVQMKEVQSAQKSKLMEVQQQYLHDHWNQSALEIAFGRVYTYNNDWDTLNFQKAGFGIWVNGAKSIGYRAQVGGIIGLKRVGVNNDIRIGSNFRYGNHRFNFFTELVYEALKNYSGNGFSEEELLSSKFAQDLGNGWFQYEEGLEAISYWNTTFGGNFRLSNGIMLNFALRTRFNEKMQFQKFLPIANVTCLMR